MDPLFVSSMAVLLAIISNIASIWGNMKRRPPLDRELAQLLPYDKHHELCKEQTTTLWARIIADRAAWEKESQIIRGAMKQDSEIILRAIGRLEGRIHDKFNHDV